jgi:hypothetical protein
MIWVVNLLHDRMRYGVVLMEYVAYDKTLQKPCFLEQNFCTNTAMILLGQLTPPSYLQETNKEQ